MCSTGDNAALPALGFPIRASTGQRPFSASPWLIAAVHALHRLLVPRHPPCALTILTVIRPVRLEAGAGQVIPVFSRRLSMAADVASVQFSRTAERRSPAGAPLRANARLLRSARGPADAGLSKLNSMLDRLCRRRRLAPSSKGRPSAAGIQPGSVDMLGPASSDTATPHGRAAACAGAPLGAP